MKVYILLFAIGLSSCHNEISFDRIDLESGVGRCPDGTYSCYSESFIVYNYRSSKENEEKIDSFVCQQILKDTIDYKTHFFYFYNHSRISNLRYIEKNLKYWNADALYRDFIIHYSFYNSEFSDKSYGRSPKFRTIYYDKMSCDYH